VIGNRFISPL